METKIEEEYKIKKTNQAFYIIIEIIIQKKNEKENKIGYNNKKKKKEGEQKKTETYEGINTGQSNIEDILESWII